MIFHSLPTADMYMWTSGVRPGAHGYYIARTDHVRLGRSQLVKCDFLLDLITMSKEKFNIYTVGFSAVYLSRPAAAPNETDRYNIPITRN